MKHNSIRVAAASAAILAVAACGGSDEGAEVPATVPPATPTTDAPPTTSTSAPNLPDVAGELMDYAAERVADPPLPGQAAGGGAAASGETSFGYGTDDGPDGRWWLFHAHDFETRTCLMMFDGTDPEGALGLPVDAPEGRAYAAAFDVDDCPADPTSMNWSAAVSVWQRG